MTQAHVEIIRRCTDARNKRDVDAAVKDLHPDVELDWSESRAAAGGMVEDVIRGRDQLRALLVEWLEVFEATWQTEEFVELGPDRVLEVSSVRMRGRDGIEVGAPGAFLWDFDAGKAVRVKFFPSKERALEALGRSEQRANNFS